MASFFVISNETVARTLLAGENGFISVNATLYTETVSTVSIGGAGVTTLTVMGTLATATGFAAVRTTTTTVQEIELVVGSLGNISGSVNVTVNDKLMLRNAGLISGDIAVFTQGWSGFDSAEISNTGTIQGSGMAVALGTLIDNVRLNNSGNIISTEGVEGAIYYQCETGILMLANSGTISVADMNDNVIDSRGYLQLTNSGTINGRVVGTDFMDILNSGQINGTVGSTSIDGMRLWNDGTILFGVTCGAGSTDVVNSGLIQGDLAGTNDLFLQNFGTITGDVSALNAGTAGRAATVINQGIIGDDVNLTGLNDLFTNSGGSVAGLIVGGAGDDRFVIDRGDLQILGGTGSDTVESSANYRMGVGVEVLLLTGDQGLVGTGRNSNESLTGGAGNDILSGRGGLDLLTGGEGDDQLLGGIGRDTLALSEGFDTMNGGAGLDAVLLGSSAFGAVVRLPAGTVTIADSTGDVLAQARLISIEDIGGTNFADDILGSASNNLLDGGWGNDTIAGGDGDDEVVGGLGNDELQGNGGVDRIEGGSGRDTMTGGGLADTFVFTAITDSAAGLADLINTFEVARDIIDIEELYGDPNAPSDTPFLFIGTAAFSGNGPEVRYVQDAGAGTTRVEILFGESTAIDMEITLSGLLTLTAANFIL